MHASQEVIVPERYPSRSCRYRPKLDRMPLKHFGFQTLQEVFDVIQTQGPPQSEAIANALNRAWIHHKILHFPKSPPVEYRFLQWSLYLRVPQQSIWITIQRKLH